MLRLKLVAGSVGLLALAGQAAAASAEVAQAMTALFTLLGIAVLLWIVGNFLTYHRYDSGGPKGGPVQRP